MSSKRETIFVCDGPWYLHRVFYTTKTNRPLIEVIPYRLLSMICKDALAVRAKYVCCAFDGPNVFRYKVYPLYKSDRDKNKSHAEKVDDGYRSSASDQDVYDFLEPIYELFAKIGMGFYQPKRYEADDVLCSIANKYKAKYRVICGTTDKDAYQYLGEYVSLYDSSYKDPQTKQPAPRFITAADAEKRKGVRIDQMLDYQTLIGDRGDSIPPIKGYGPVTAKKLLEEHGTLQAWYAQSTGKERRFIRENLELFRRNRKLVQLVDTCAPPSSVDEWKLYKEKPDMSLPGTYHDLHSVLYPKTRGLFG